MLSREAILDLLSEPKNVRTLSIISGVTGFCSIVLAPFSILTVATNKNSHWHRDSLKYGLGAPCITLGVISVLITLVLLAVPFLKPKHHTETVETDPEQR